MEGLRCLQDAHIDIRLLDGGAWTETRQIFLLKLKLKEKGVILGYKGTLGLR